MKRAGKTFSCPWLFIHLPFKKGLYHWKKTHASVITLLMANKVFSKSVLDIKTRLVVTVKLGTKWMPNSDSVSNFMPEYKFLGY